MFYPLNYERGALGRNRTCDARAFNAPLYQLSYKGIGC